VIAGFVANNVFKETRSFRRLTANCPGDLSATCFWYRYRDPGKFGPWCPIATQIQSKDFM